jgi:teichuronic acid biosynthesis glycosyltransferase TuaC
MRVLTFTSLFPNSVHPLLGLFVQQRVSHFARRAGNCVEVIAPVAYVPPWILAPRWNSFRRIPPKERIGDLTVYHPRYPLIPKVSMPFHGVLMFLGSIRLAARLHRKNPFDCIDAHYVYPDGLAAVLIGKLIRVPVIITARGTDINLFSHFHLIEPMIRWTLAHAAGSVTVSKALKEAEIELGLEGDRVEVITNGIDDDRFKPLAKDDARSLLGVPRDAQIVVSVASLLPAKGLQYLIPAIGRLQPDFKDLRLYIIGEGVFRSKLETLVRTLRLDHKVFLVGSKSNDDLRLWFSASDTTCLPSSREGSPNVILESLACGTPVVATPVGGIPEIIVSEELGILTEQSVPALAASIDIALRKSWNRELISRQGRYRTWKVVAAEIDSYFNLITKRSRNPAATFHEHR